MAAIGAYDVLVEMVAAQLRVADDDDGDQLVPARFELRIGVNIQDAHGPAELGGERLQSFEQIVAQVAPLPAHDDELVAARHSPARRVT